MTVLLAAVALWFGLRAVDVGTQKAALNREVSELQTKIKSLQENNQTLQRVISFIHDPDFLAREARRRLNFRAADEKVAFVYPDESKTASAASADSSDESILAKIKNWLYDAFQK